LGSTGAVDRPSDRGGATGRDIGLVCVVILLAWVAGAVASASGSMLAWALTAVAALVAAAISRDRPVVLFLALLPATLLVATGLVPDSGRYQPIAVVVGPLCALVGWRVVRGVDRMRVPDVPVAASLVVYILWTAVTVVASTARGGSAVYFGGILVTLAVIYGIAPTLVADVRARRRVLVVVGAMGIACALAGLLLAAGPVVLFGRAVGQYEIVELTWLGDPTGIVLLHVIGPFLASNGQGINCALGLIAIVALRIGASGRWRTVLTIGAIILVIALLDSLSRNGWMVAILGLAAMAVPDVLRRRPTFVVTMATIMVVAFGILLVNVVGADARPDLMAERYGAAGANVGGDLSAPPTAQPAPTPSPSPAPAASPTPQGAAPRNSMPGAIVLAVLSAEERSSATPAPDPSPSATPTPASPAPVRAALRGGSGLTGRIDLWRASITATRERPLFGWGLGQVIEAIAPWVPPSLAGLTSHSTWFRMAVETGMPGLLALVAWVLASGAMIVRRLIRDREARVDPIRLAFVGSFLGLTAAATFDTFLLGGVTFMNVYWALSAVLAAAAVAPAVTQRGADGATISPD
jgi:O-Antigen ligase